jgi:hypothetical protein
LSSCRHAEEPDGLYQHPARLGFSSLELRPGGLASSSLG